MAALLVGADEHVVDGGGEPVAWPLAMAGGKGYRAAWEEAIWLLGYKGTVRRIAVASQSRDRPTLFHPNRFEETIREA